MPFYAAKCKELYERHGWLRNDDCVDYFPHDARVEEWGTGITRLEQLIKKGFHPRISTEMSLHDGINAARAILPITEFDDEGCAEGIKALQQYRKTWNDDAGLWSDTPFRNWAIHGADAYRYLAGAYRDPGPEKAAPPPPKGSGIDVGKIRDEMMRAQQSGMMRN